MSGTLFIIILIVVAITAVYFIGQNNPAISNRLKDVHATYQGEYESRENLPLYERILKPVYDKLSTLISRLTPQNISKEYVRLITQAGYPRTYTPDQLLTKQILLVTVAGAMGLLMMYILPGTMKPLNIIVSMILAAYYPVFNLRKKAKKRQWRIQKDLPYLLDMVYISVRAGLSFDMAMRTTATKMDNPLGYEVVRAMEDIARGRNREEALRSIGERTYVDDVRIFISTMIQSEQLGSNIADVLKIQALMIRDKRAQQAEAEANKMPIKMLPILVFFLFPAIFIVIMGPAVINVMRTMPSF